MALAGRRIGQQVPRPSASSSSRLIVRAAAASSSGDSGSGNKKKAVPAAASASAASAASSSLARPTPRQQQQRPAPAPSEEDNDDENDAPVFVDRDGVAIRVMPWDYGFRSGAARTGGVVAAAAAAGSNALALRSPARVRVSPPPSASTASLSSGSESDDGEDQQPAIDINEGSYVRGRVPASLASVARANFRAELFALRASFRRDDYGSIAAAAAPTAGPVRRAAGAAGGAVAELLQRADRALEEAGVLPRLDLGPGTTVGAGATSAATAPSSSSASEGEPECSVVVVEDKSFVECVEGPPSPWRRVLAALDELTLDDHAVAARDAARDRVLSSSSSSSSSSPPASSGGGGGRAPLLVRLPFAALCVLLDVLYAGRPLQRFWVLETVARVPYFAYISVLHAYESVGLWRAGAELRRVHFAEEYNELHHLQIMESLGGDRLWVDRFVAEHSAVLYYWGLVALYALAPRQAYRFSELVELHAYDSYDQFVSENEEALKAIPPPLVAARYYRSSETLYMFDGFQDACGNGERAAADRVLMAGKEGGSDKGPLSASSWASLAVAAAASSSSPAPPAPRAPRRPPCNNLYDVFVNIRDDEAEHVVTMKACADDAVPEL